MAARTQSGAADAKSYVVHSELLGKEGYVIVHVLGYADCGGDAIADTSDSLPFMYILALPRSCAYRKREYGQKHYYH